MHRTILAGLILATASGCVTSGGSSDASSDDWSPNGLTSIAAFGPLPEAADGRGPGLDPRLTSGVLGAGAIVDVDATTVIELVLAEGSRVEGLAGGRDALTPVNAVFSVQTVAQLEGRLTVRRLDATGALADGTLRVTRGSLVRDGELLAALRPGSTITIQRVEPDTEGGEPVQALLSGGSPVSADVSRLLRLSLLDPAAPIEWAELRGSGDRLLGGSVRRLGADGVTLMMGPGFTVAQDSAPGTAPRGTIRAAANGDRLEARLVAPAVRDARIVGMFGESVRGPMRAALVHRRSLLSDQSLARDATTDAGAAAGPILRTESLTSTRFSLRDADGPIDGERLERLDLQLTVRRPATDGGG